MINPYKYIASSANVKINWRTPGRLKTALLMGIVFVAFSSQLVVFQSIAIVALVYIVFQYSPLFNSASIAEKRAIHLLLLVLTVSWPVAQMRNSPAMAHYVVTLFSVLSAFIITRDLRTYLFASRLLLISVLTYIFIYLANTGLENLPLEDMIPGGSSSNGVTSYLLVAQVNYSIVRYLLHKKPTVVSSLLTLFVCYVGYGRASLLAAIAIFIINFAIFLPGRYRIFIAFIIVVVSINAFYVYEDDIEFIINTTKLGSGLYDQHREQQLADYFSRIDALTLMTGASYEGTSIASTYLGNPHNSYIRAHHIFGLPYLLVIILFPFILLSFRLFISRMIYPVIMFMILLLRAATETILFPTLFDIFFFAMCFAMQIASKKRILGSPL